MADSFESPRPWTRTDSLLAVASLGLSVAPVVLIGVQWVATWASLGHRPIYNGGLDYREGFGGILELLDMLSALAAVLLFAMPFCSLFWWVRRRESRTGRILALATLVLPVASFAILWADPYGITSWWVD